MIKTAKKIAYTLLVRTFPSAMGYAIQPKGKGYLNAKTVVSLAKAEGLPVSEYLEKSNTGGVGKRRDDIISILQENNFLNICNRIVEIGAGSGMYMEKFIEICKPADYEVYETDVGWSNYLKETYATLTRLDVHNASGDSMSKSATNSADIVAAHGVFVYLPIVITMQYLKEAARVCKPTGLIIFDCFTDRIFTVQETLQFRAKNPYYDFPVVINEQLIEDVCTNFNLKKVFTFDSDYHLTKSTYFILQKL